MLLSFLIARDTADGVFPIASAKVLLQCKQAAGNVAAAHSVRFPVAGQSAF